MRRSYGRDFGLSLRMALGLGLVGLIYVVAELICVAITVAGLIDHDWETAAGGVFIGALVVLLASPRCRLAAPLDDLSIPRVRGGPRLGATGAPQNLISALVKIDGGEPPRQDLRGGLAVQAFCIVSRRSRWRRFELMMDHPPVRKRISRPEELARELGKAAG